MTEPSLETQDPVTPAARDRPEFRPDLEGLRAVAVGLVLLYHAAVPGFAGGYIGVDVFFVLSGFLITRLLIRELRSTGRISLPAFYARRARRLLPAAAVTLLVTAIVSAVVLPPLRVASVETDIAAAAAYVSNMRFAFQATDYLASDLPPSPVLHFWSLGVEEQFYLFWPALLLLTAGSAFAAGNVARGLARIGTVIVVVLVGSAALSVWLTGVAQPWAFFTLPARAWELALGALLALPAVARLAPAGYGWLLGWAGIGVVIASGVLLTEETPFPGTAAFLPALGSALVIASGVGEGAGSGRLETSAARFLSLPPMRYLGRISYSLYLWHWPILVLPAAVLGHLPGLVRIALAALAVVVAAASQRWVEEPIRHGRIVGTRPRRVLAIAGTSTAVVFAFGLSLGSISAAGVRPSGAAAGGSVEDVQLPPVASSAPPSSRPTRGVPTTSSPTEEPTLPVPPRGPVPADLAPELAAASDDLPVIYSDGCHLDAGGTTIPSCAFGDEAASRTVVLFGDSHAAQWFPALERLARERDWRLLTMTKSACASVDVRVWSTILNRPYTECDVWRENAFERIAREHPSLVVVSNSARYPLNVDGAQAPSSEHQDLWDEGLASTLERLRPLADAVVLIGDTPRRADDPLACLSEHLDDASRCATPYDEAVLEGRLVHDAAIARDNGATFVDPTPWICFTDPCAAVNGRLLIYRDEHHLTATYSRALAKPLLEVLPPVR